MLPIIVVTGWVHALALMHHGWWSTRAGPGVFWSTIIGPNRGPVFGVSREGMVYLIRHGYECTHARGWVCAPDTIGRGSR